jgi:tetratricopeptide (TPR) repeat protein
MAKRSVVMFTVVLCSMISNRADAFGYCARCNTGCYGYAGYWGGAENCGLGWGACGSAWRFGYGGYGATRCGYGCAPRCHHLFPIFGQYGWFHKLRCAGCGGGGCSNCGYGGCVRGGCTCGTCTVSASTDGRSKSNIISEQPAPAAESAPETAPSDRSASIHRSPYHSTSARQDGSIAFQKGITVFRQGKMREALGEFEAAASAEPKNALYPYHRALATFDLAGADAAQEALKQAIEAESLEPVKNWGKRMERVQGRGRVWIETARRNAGLVH